LSIKPFFLCSILTLSISLNVSAEHWQQQNYIIDSFYEIALKSEYSPRSSALKKWHSPIYYYIDHRSADQELHQRLVKIHSGHLSSITGVKITETPDRSKANLTIIFSQEQYFSEELKADFGLKDQTQRARLTKNSVCLAQIKTAKNGEIVKAAIIIPVDRARSRGKLLSCIVEELTQAMGLANDSVAVYPSIFNDKSFNDTLSGLDFLLLTLLYNKKLKAGMSKQQITPILKQAVTEPKFQLLIENAEKKVNRKGIAALLNQ
jgi:hypothetical protein